MLVFLFIEAVFFIILVFIAPGNDPFLGHCLAIK